MGHPSDGQSFLIIVTRPFSTYLLAAVHSASEQRLHSYAKRMWPERPMLTFGWKHGTTCLWMQCETLHIVLNASLKHPNIGGRLFFVRPIRKEYPRGHTFSNAWITNAFLILTSLLVLFFPRALLLQLRQIWLQMFYISQLRNFRSVEELRSFCHEWHAPSREQL